jgi:hypothetical protein
MAKPHGKRGSWFADWRGETLPCVHQFWWKNGGYHDIYARPGVRKFEELVEAIKRVILTKDETPDGGHSFQRLDYICIFEVEDVQFDDGGLRFRCTSRQEFN